MRRLKMIIKMVNVALASSWLLLVTGQEREYGNCTSYYDIENCSTIIPSTPDIYTIFVIMVLFLMGLLSWIFSMYESDRSMMIPEVGGRNISRLEMERNVKIDILFMLDASSSVGRRDFERMKFFSVDILSAFLLEEVMIRIALLTYSEDTVIQILFSERKSINEASKVLLDLHFLNSTTHTSNAFAAVMNEGLFTFQKGGRRDSAKVILLISDGIPRSQLDTTVGLARRIRRGGVAIVAIGIKDCFHNLELVTGDKMQTYYCPHSYNLRQIAENVITRICEISYNQLQGVSPTQG